MPWANNGQVATDELPGGIEISEEQYALAIEGVIEGKIISIDGGFTISEPPSPELPETPEPPTLDEIKSWLKAGIDSAAENERLKYITPGFGQAMTYMQKAAEAARYLATVEPEPADYPMLSAEVGITAETLAGVATVVNDAYTQWQMIGAAIESIRLSAKASIGDASSEATARAIFEAVAWPVIG
ncbi:hypothetical protein ASE04_09615 [Rhizobium sp. Root708]|uniref:hypothetical protein n=1 Tax=Rhizobium sp. Root708 TaxID=1736592 RepID=UPI0006FAD3D3|nr:hypothetical protein [Rhizobium sp. Root708]KRB51781.1 hypothetical protein ASE04_09615 [Rhizobium sp. Root708]